MIYDDPTWGKLWQVWHPESEETQKIPFGKLTKNNGKSPSLVKSTIIGPLSIAMLNYQRVD